MRITLPGLVAALALVAFVSGIAQPLAASAQAGQTQAQEKPQAQTAKGELRSVDSAKQTLTISVDNKDQVFQYNEQTKVTGAQGGVAGLATSSGKQVTVQFMSKGADRIATAIEIAQ
jgi:type II secretory pathway pseudopilin PulG